MGLFNFHYVSQQTYTLVREITKRLNICNNLLVTKEERGFEP